MDAAVAAVFADYPEVVKQQLMNIRTMILRLAEDREVESVSETLKWGQPSYLSPQGSTVRVGWSAKQPEQFGVYFHCQTQLIETFRQLYPDTFNYQGNRAIVFSVEDDVPLEPLQHCIMMALRYHRVKHLPLLGG